jgi:hypothetical protein
MAKKFVDAAVKDPIDALAIQDGTALTLTGKVRVLYDDTTPEGDLIAALERCKARIIDQLG